MKDFAVKTEGSVEAGLWQADDDQRYDLLMIASSGLIAVSAVIIAMTVSVMVS